VLVEKMTARLPFGTLLTVITLFSEGILLVVAAQAGFLDGPRVLANMAVDHWVPRRFSALSDRLTAQNGIVLMGAASLAALFYTHGDVGKIVVMYSINVFLTFSLSLFAMARKTLAERRLMPGWIRKAAVFVVGFLLCATILAITVFEKFGEGGWLTLVVTALVVALCFVIRGHYRQVRLKLTTLYQDVRELDDGSHEPIPITDRNAPTACVLVATYDGVGIHTVLNVFRSSRGTSRISFSFRWVSSTRAVSRAPTPSRRSSRRPSRRSSASALSRRRSTGCPRPTSSASAPTPSPRRRRSAARSWPSSPP